MRATSSVLRGKATAEGAGAYTLVQSRPYSARSEGSYETVSGGSASRSVARSSSESVAIGVRSTASPFE